MTKKELLTMAYRLNAKDITTTMESDLPLYSDVDTIEITCGTYGMNAGLFRNRVTGEFYVIKTRSINLFRFA